jgi:PGF-CTERM protein
MNLTTSQLGQIQGSLIAFISLGLVAGLLIAPLPVAAQEPAPAAYYGSVTVDGDSAPAGVEVTAELAGETYGPIETDADGTFGGSAAADEKLDVTPETAPNNKLITFYVNGQQVDQTATWEPFGGGEIELSIDELPDESSEPESDPEDDGSQTGGEQTGGGQGGGGQAGGTNTESEPSGPPTVAEVKDTLQLAEATAETEVEIEDTNTEDGGVTVSPDEGETVQSITFESESVSGSVETKEYSDVPDRVSEEVSTSVADEVDSVEYDSTSGTADRDVNVHAVADISPTTDEAEETAATVELTVDATTVDDPDQLTIVKEHYSFTAQTERWKELETTVTAREGNEITVEAPVDEFSLFAVTEIEAQTDTEEQATNDGAESGDDPPDGGTDSSIPGFGIGVVLTAILTVSVLLARRG